MNDDERRYNVIQLAALCCCFTMIVVAGLFGAWLLYDSHPGVTAPTVTTTTR